MNNFIKLIKALDKQNDIQSISSNNLPIWQYVRNLLYSKNQLNNSWQPVNRLKNFYRLMKNYQWKSLDKKTYQYVLFTDFKEQIKHDNRLIDKTSQNLINILKEQLLVVVNPGGYIHKSNLYNNTNYMSTSFFHYNRWKSGLVKTVDIKNQTKLKNYLQKYNIELNIDYYNQLFFTYVKIFTNWLDDVRPDAIFINCHYSLFHQALIYVCKKNEIQTIEMQHGLISEAHTQYSPQQFIGKDTFPNYILTHSDNVKTVINNHFIDSQNIIPIGHYYLETILNEGDDKNKQSTLSGYEKTVVVSTQHDTENELIQLVQSIASKVSNVLFRIKCRDTKNITLSEKNIKIDKNENIYNLVKSADLHISCYSTVALEASMLGTPTILININNMAKIYYESICKKFNSIKICETDDDVIDLINNWTVDTNVDKTYTLNNKNNIKTFINNYINNENSIHIS